MPAYIFVRPYEKRGSEFAWKKTPHKSFSAWERATHAVSHMVRQGPIAEQIFKMPSGRLVDARLMEPGSVEMAQRIERVMDDVVDTLVDKRVSQAERAKALKEAFIRHGVSLDAPGKKVVAHRRVVRKAPVKRKTNSTRRTTQSV